jgi:hypothetical protein
MYFKPCTCQHCIAERFIADAVYAKLASLAGYANRTIRNRLEFEEHLMVDMEYVNELIAVGGSLELWNAVIHEQITLRASLVAASKLKGDALDTFTREYLPTRSRISEGKPVGLAEIHAYINKGEIE